MLIAVVATIVSVSSNSLLAQPLSLTVDEAVARALEHNPGLRIAKATMDQRNAESWQATTTRLPRVDLNGTYQKTDPGFFPDQATYINEEQWTAQIRASHTVISGGSVHGQSQAAGALAKASQYDYRATKLETARVVKEAFYNALLSKRLLDVANEAVSINEEEVRRANVQFEIGEAARINVLRAEVQLANSIPEALRAKHNLRLAKTRLANLIGYDINPNDVEVSELQLEGELVADHRLELPDLERLIDAALTNRSELKSAEKSVDAAGGEARTAWSGVLPRVDVYGEYNWMKSSNKVRILDSTGSIAREVPIDFDFNDLNGWQVGATATMPLFNFFGNVKGVQAGRAKVRRAEIAEEDLRRTVELEVRSAYSAYLESIEAVSSQEKNVERARESLRLARQSQSAGEATQLDVQQAQLDLTQASSLSAQAQRDLLMAEASLLTATGLENLEEAARYGVAVVSQ